jgi:hypothetical protein
MFIAKTYRDTFLDRVDSIRRLLDVADPPGIGHSVIGREARGLAIVLLFASYENLLKGLCRGLLETTVKLRVSNKRLKPGIKRVVAFPVLESVYDLSKGGVWSKVSAKIVSEITKSSSCTINVNTFPNDGSFMKSSQVYLFCEVFDLGDPGRVLKDVL